MSFPISFLIAALLGFLSGLGVGGGSILMIWLTLIAGLDYPEAKQINLLFFLASGAVACAANIRKSKINFSVLLPIVLSGIASAYFFSRISANWDTSLLKKLFGALLVAAGIRELLFRQRKQSSSSD